MGTLRVDQSFDVAGVADDLGEIGAADGGPGDGEADAVAGAQRGRRAASRLAASRRPSGGGVRLSMTTRRVAVPEAVGEPGASVTVVTTRAWDGRRRSRSRRRLRGAGCSCTRCHERGEHRHADRHRAPTDQWPPTAPPPSERPPPTRPRRPGRPSEDGRVDRRPEREGEVHVDQ